MEPSKMLPEVEALFELVGYTPGPIVLTDGRPVDFRTLSLQQVEQIYANGTAAPYLVKKPAKPEKKKKSESAPESSDQH